MNLQLLIPSIATSLVVICVSLGVILIVSRYINNRVRDRLQDVISVHNGDDRAKSVILRDMDLSSIPFVNDLLKHTTWARKIERLLAQADFPMRVGSFVMLTLFVGSLGALAAMMLSNMLLVALPAGAVMALLPLGYVRYRKMKRTRRFESQFPDTLDMLTNALRAGMALPVAMQVVAEESPDPVGREFAILFEENRLGLDLRDALKKLAERVDSPELHLFVIAVTMQRETGGNLVEILEGTAAVIRDRFRILGDVRSMTGQARLSGIILGVLPLVVAGFVTVITPDYLPGLASDPVGRNLIVAAVLLQLSGYMLMRRIISIKV